MPFTPRPPLPPFTPETAAHKVRAAEDAWNSRDPDLVTPAYSTDSRWRNRSAFLTGHAQIHAFLSGKWQRELDYRLNKSLWAFHDDSIAVRFAYEWRDNHGQWTRSYGNENWQFAPDGRMQQQIAAINDLAIHDSDRLFRWPAGPRPADHPGLEDLNL